MARIPELLAKGDAAGATELMEGLKAQGLDVPSLPSPDAGGGDKPSCAACGKPASGTCGTVGGKLYHKECLKCAACSGPLKGGMAQTSLGPTCKGCVESIQ